MVLRHAGPRPTRRSARHPRARLAFLPLSAALVAALSACSPLSLFSNWGSAPSPSASRSAEAAPSPTSTPSPIKHPTASPSAGCVDRVISLAGEYRIGDCENLTVEGSGIKVTAAHLGTLTIRGDSLQVLAQTIRSLDVDGSLNNVQTNNDMGTILITGDRNMITCNASVASVIVNGDDNTVRVEGGVDGAVQNNGQRNEIGAQP